MLLGRGDIVVHLKNKGNYNIYKYYWGNLEISCGYSTLDDTCFFYIILDICISENKACKI